ncbi:ankyrin repeat domain-containing protein [Dactylosporangium sp. NPDC005572]|uniref:ankyrin repeat domain-containing protein n=1 Tax=Dactylosporangium sp. NPDC005572 TaxID=3156889 RepID=UPI0033BEFC57
MVPAWMVEHATSRRLAGDWRGACAAAFVHEQIDLADIARRDGAEVASAVEDELRHLVPDLLRWHLPRRPDGLLRAGRYYPLAMLGDRQALIAFAPERVGHPQRIILRFWPLAGANRWARRDDTMLLHRERWDSRCTAELGTQCAGWTGGLLAALLRLDDAGRHAEAWAAAGYTLESSADPDAALGWLRPMHLALPTVACRVAPASELVKIDFRGHYLVLGRPPSRVRLVRRAAYHRVDEDRRRAEVAEFGRPLAEVPTLPHSLVRRPPALDGLLTGRLRPADLHPLVHEALFPGAPPPAHPVERLRPVVRVHCDHATHEVVMRDGTLALPHSPAEIDRERMLRALGGEVQGCVAAYDGWRDPAVRMPSPMRTLRASVLALVQQGDGPALASALDNGLDPHLRDERGRTLLHLLPWLTGADLLDRLMATGLPVDVRDLEGRTPLHDAVAHGTPDLVRALLAAGADPNARSTGRWPSPARSTTRPDLAFLRHL